RLAERQLPLMDHVPAHVEERGPCPLGRRDQSEAVVRLAWSIRGKPFLHVAFRRKEGIHHRLATFVPSLAAGECLRQEIVRRKLEEHHGRPEDVTEASDAEDREAREYLAKMGSPDWDARVKEPAQPRREEVDGSSHGQ